MNRPDEELEMTGSPDIGKPPVKAEQFQFEFERLEHCPYCGKLPVFEPKEPENRQVFCLNRECPIEGRAFSIVGWNTRAKTAQTYLAPKFWQTTRHGNG